MKNTFASYNSAHSTSEHYYAPRQRHVPVESFGSRRNTRYGSRSPYQRKYGFHPDITTRPSIGADASAQKTHS